VLGEVEKIAAQYGAITPSLVALAAGLGYNLKPAIDSWGNVSALYEQKDGKGGCTLAERLREMQKDPETSFMFGVAGDRVTPQVNPWRKTTFNLTKQGEMVRTNPQMAARMQAEAKALK